MFFTSAASQVSICNQALARCGVKQFITTIADTSQEAIVLNLFWDAVRQKLLAGFPWKFAVRQSVLQAFTPQCSAIEHIGSLVAAPFTVSINPTYGTLEGTYNVVLRVTTSGGSGVGAVQVSFDGGITWGDPTVVSTGPTSCPQVVPSGTGNPMTGGLLLTFTSGFSLVAGSIYRFTATDGVSPEYTYAYALPSDVLVGRYLWPGSRSVRSDQRVPWKRGSFGSVDVLWSDANPTQTPTIIYVEDVTDASRFPAGFVDALAWRLAYEISGPLKASAAPQDLERAYLMAINEARSVDFIEFQEDRPPDSETVAARGYNWAPYGVGGIPPPGGWFPY